MQADSSTGLVRFGFRDYDPVSGRWAAKDPVLFTGAQANLFTYCGNNPVNLVDRWGLRAEPAPCQEDSFWSDLRDSPKLWYQLEKGAQYVGVALTVVAVASLAGVVAVSGTVLLIAGAGIAIASTIANVRLAQLKERSWEEAGINIGVNAASVALGAGGRSVTSLARAAAENMGPQAASAVMSTGLQIGTSLQALTQ